MPFVPSSKPRHATRAKTLIDGAGSELSGQIREGSIEDLLCRPPVHIDGDSIRARLQGRVVMVTGAAGSIGAELCRQIARFNPQAIVGFDQAETPLFHIERELAKSFPALAFHAEIGNIARRDDLDRMMLHYQPSILFHAAAYKHVHLMEKHVFAAVENNVFGTWQVALAAANHGVEDFVLISTDKAVRPASMMGATKRMAELVIRSMQQERGTRFIAVRFGNVLGSNGSVVPIFLQQIAAGGPVTVTHPEMRRYFITIPEAAQLVLQAFSIGKGGEIFALDMGEPVRIVELARAMIDLSGLDPDRDIDVEIVGRRPGEKLHEELFNSYERPRATDAEKILLAEREPLGVEEVESMFAEIGLLVLEGDAAGLAAKVSELSAARGVPEAPEESAVEDVNGADPDRDRRGAPAPLIHSPDS